MKILYQSLSDQVYNLIKMEILNGTIKGGEKISEDRLAEQFGVSRTPIREAMRRLSEYGLVNISPRSHASVIEINEKDARDIAELRVDLESFAIDHIDINSLNSNIQEISRFAAECNYELSIGERAKSFEIDSLFHIALIKATSNQALIDTYIRLDAKIQLLRIDQNLPETSLSKYMMQHTELIQLIKNDNRLEAKKLIKEHIQHEQGIVC